MLFLTYFVLLLAFADVTVSNVTYKINCGNFFSQPYILLPDISIITTVPFSKIYVYRGSLTLMYNKS